MLVGLITFCTSLLSEHGRNGFPEETWDFLFSSLLRRGQVEKNIYIRQGYGAVRLNGS
jgi:hypothetical protein